MRMRVRPMGGATVQMFGAVMMSRHVVARETERAFYTIALLLQNCIATMAQCFDARVTVRAR